MTAGAAPEAAAGSTPIAKGTELPAMAVRVTRADLVRYAGASGDFNPIHWNDRTAEAVGLPGVIAHGMFTMAQAGRFLTAWAGAGSVRSLGVRFTRPVVVPDDDEGALVEFSGVVSDVVEVAGERIAKVTIKAVFDGRTVLGKAVAEVALA